MKADGLYAPPTGTAGRVMTSLLASEGISLPTVWFSAKSGRGTLAERREFSTPCAPENNLQAPLSINILPLNFAVESRVDFGRKAGSVRTISKRLAIELTSFTLPELRDLEVGTSELTVAGGPCYLLHQWSEEVM